MLALSLLISAASAPAPARAEEAARPAHPEPRVIVSVLSLAGPHEPDAVQRHARFAWGKVVRCYKSIDRSARGSITIELAVTGSGSSSNARRLRTTLQNPELSACLTRI